MIKIQDREDRREQDPEGLFLLVQGADALHVGFTKI